MHRNLDKYGSRIPTIYDILKPVLDQEKRRKKFGLCSGGFANRQSRFNLEMRS
jgi:hypothetical protein